MEHVAKIEVTLTGEAARLYEIIANTVESVSPAELNRAILETGLVHHTLMLAALEVLEHLQRVEAGDLIDAIGKRTIMKELYDHAREYWEDQSNMGTIQPNDEV